VGPGGSFAAVWRVNHIGRFAIRAVIVASSARAATSSPTLTLTVYRAAIATQYGPGFYGNRTACGELLTPRTLGVASRTLRCGTAVAIYYRGRTIMVPVIDRGPYANGADWDLTTATARALGIGGTATIGAVSLPPRR
jgi:rare lipoprotein A (peptidoglycan hydrolase)